MNYLFVRQRVENFDRWYAIFSSHAEAQREAGLRDLRLLRDIDDPEVIVCMFRVEDMEKARAFTGSGDAGDARKESRVIGKPEILFLSDIE